MNFDKMIKHILEGYSSEATKREEQMDSGERNIPRGATPDTKSYWTVTKKDGTKKYFTKQPKAFPGEKVSGPFKGTPPSK